MGEISRARLLQFVGGLLGIAAFFLPWVAYTLQGPRLSLTSTDLIVTTFQYLLGDESLFGLGGVTFTLGLVVVTVGVLLLLASSAMTLISPYGGPLMFVASAISVSGITVMSVATAGSFPLLLRFAVDYGAFVAFSGAIIAIMGLLYHRASLEDQKIETPPTKGEQG